MKTELAIERVKQLSQSKKTVIINFKLRSPIIGKFIQADDFEHLASKKMVRFVNKSCIEYYEKTERLEYSKIYNVSDFVTIKEVKHESNI